MSKETSNLIDTFKEDYNTIKINVMDGNLPGAALVGGLMVNRLSSCLKGFSKEMMDRQSPERVDPNNKPQELAPGQ